MFNVQSSMLRGKEIVEDLEAALEQFREIAADLGADVLTERDKLWNCSDNRLLQSSVPLHLVLTGLRRSIESGGEIELLDSLSPCDICAFVSLPHH
jgi:hypothetical protein